jgi:predicted transposase YbfD/YdcC
VYLLRDHLTSRQKLKLSHPAHAEFVICDCTIENGFHYVKDVTMGEDKSTVHCDNGPKIMAALRNTVVSLLHHAGFSTIAARMRYNSTHPQAAFEVLSLSL